MQITTGSAKLDHLLKGGVETGQITEAGFGNRKGPRMDDPFFLGREKRLGSRNEVCFFVETRSLASFWPAPKLKGKR